MSKKVAVIPERPTFEASCLFSSFIYLFILNSLFEQNGTNWISILFYTTDINDKCPKLPLKKENLYLNINALWLFSSSTAELINCVKQLHLTIPSLSRRLVERFWVVHVDSFTSGLDHCTGQWSGGFSLQVNADLLLQNKPIVGVSRWVEVKLLVHASSSARSTAYRIVA